VNAPGILSSLSVLIRPAFLKGVVCLLYEIKNGRRKSGHKVNVLLKAADETTLKSAGSDLLKGFYVPITA
jgi:hypothetical protein